MAVAHVSSGNQDTVGTHLQSFEDKIGTHTAGTHHPNDAHVGRILKAADACQVSCRIGTPVTGKRNDPGVEFFGHILMLPFQLKIVNCLLISCGIVFSRHNHYGEVSSLCLFINKSIRMPSVVN
jgi:hypothetical protein